MAMFNNMTLTTKGQLLYVKAQAGQEIKFTKMMVGSGDIDSRNPSTLLSLIEPKFDVGIQSITPNTEQKIAVISGKIDNSFVTEATYICEIGLFAKDPDDGEVLYAYGTAGKYGDYYAPATSGPFSWSYDIEATIGNAANVTVELSNLTFDYGVKNTNTTFIVISGGNQKEINKSIDQKLSDLSTQQKEIANKVDNIKIADGTTTTKGIVKLNNATNSTSQTEAATPLAVKTAMDKANEAFTSASNGKTYIAGKVGNVTGSNTFSQIGDRVQTDKNTAASNLNNKGVSASGNEALASLASKIANISIQGMGGKKFVAGTTTPSTIEREFHHSDESGNSLGTRKYRYIEIISNFNLSRVIAYSIVNNDIWIILKINSNFSVFGRAPFRSSDGNMSRCFIPIQEGNVLFLPVGDSTGNAKFDYIGFE